MRSIISFSLLLALFVALAAAWSKEDHEIFRLNDEVTAHEGANVTFYSFIGVSSTANQDELNKAYRKKSRTLHPDKAVRLWETEYELTHKKKQSGTKPGATVGKKPSKREREAYRKEAQERFARLGTVAGILRDDRRDRYDHFLRNGFPTWRGTGYYYARFRPGLGSVLFGLFIVGGGVAHYGAMYLSWKRQREFVDRYIRHARRMAWGDETGIQGLSSVGNTATPPPPPPAAEAEEGEEAAPEPRNRREKRELEKQAKKQGKKTAARAAARGTPRPSGISTPVEATLTSGPVGAKKRVQAENGKILIVDSVGNVYLEEEGDGGVREEYLLDPDEIPKPTIYDTAVFKAPGWIYRLTVGRVLGGGKESEPLSPGAESDAPGVVLTPTTSDEEAEKLKSAVAANPNSEARKRNVKNRMKK